MSDPELLLPPTFEPNELLWLPKIFFRSRKKTMMP